MVWLMWSKVELIFGEVDESAVGFWWCEVEHGSDLCDNLEYG